MNDVRCTSCRAVVRPVVAIDIDGTISDYYFHFLKFAAAYLNMEVPDDRWYERYDGSMELEDFLHLSKGEYREVKLAYRQGGQKRLQPMLPGARDLLASCMGAGAELWLTTTRPWMKFDNTNPDTVHWLERNHLSYDHLLYDDDKYERLAEAVGPERVVGVVDDLLPNYNRAEKLGLNPLLASWPWNRFLREGQLVPVEMHTIIGITSTLVERIQSWQP